MSNAEKFNVTVSNAVVQTSAAMGSFVRHSCNKDFMTKMASLMAACNCNQKQSPEQQHGKDPDYCCDRNWFAEEGNSHAVQRIIHDNLTKTSLQFYFPEELTSSSSSTETHHLPVTQGGTTANGTVSNHSSQEDVDVNDVPHERTANRLSAALDVSSDSWDWAADDDVHNSKSTNVIEEELNLTNQQHSVSAIVSMLTDPLVDACEPSKDLNDTPHSPQTDGISGNRRLCQHTDALYQPITEGHVTTTHHLLAEANEKDSSFDFSWNGDTLDTKFSANSLEIDLVKNGNRETISSKSPVLAGASGDGLEVLAEGPSQEPYDITSSDLTVVRELLAPDYQVESAIPPTSAATPASAVTPTSAAPPASAAPPISPALSGSNDPPTTIIENNNGDSSFDVSWNGGATDNVPSSTDNVPSSTDNVLFPTAGSIDGHAKEVSALDSDKTFGVARNTELPNLYHDSYTFTVVHNGLPSTTDAKSLQPISNRLTLGDFPPISGKEVSLQDDSFDVSWNEQ